MIYDAVIPESPLTEGTNVGITVGIILGVIILIVIIFCLLKSKKKK